MNEPAFTHNKPPIELVDAYMMVKRDLETLRVGEGGMAADLGFYERLYQPDNDLLLKIEEYNTWYKDNIVNKINSTKVDNTYAGRLMEQISYLAFRSLEGTKYYKSFEAPDAQLDVVITIESQSLTYSLLHMKGEKVVVESKNMASPVGVKDFSRLCSILTYKYAEQGHLGIFFSREGASGFPQRGEKRQEHLTLSRMIQVIFHARSQGKYVLVFDHHDIQELIKPGALIKLIKTKMGDVEDLTGIVTEVDANVNERDVLPPHLAKYINSNDGQ